MIAAGWQVGGCEGIARRPSAAGVHMGWVASAGGSDGG
jgi:hypothetical protein